MRVVLFLNNWGGWQLARWLRGRDEEIVGLVVHPESDQRFASQIVDAVGLPSERIWRGPELRTPETVEAFRALKPDLGVSGWFGYVLKPDLLGTFGKGCVNLHAAYLPWNRGWHTNVWPILDGSPAGVTLHYIDEGIDTGDLIAQRAVPVRPTETGGSLHERLTLEIIDLFKQSWPEIVAGRATRTPQDHARATRHKKGDLAALDRIDLDREYLGSELLNLLRARTYPPFPAAYFTDDTRRVYLRVRLWEEEDATERDVEHTYAAQPLDLARRYEARELLAILIGSATAGSPAAFFVQDGRRIFVHVQLVNESEIDSSGNPPWQAAQLAPAGFDVVAR
jgi:methionyl-tRNA formyltransferase